MELRLEIGVSERGLRWKIGKKVESNKWEVIKEGEHTVKGRKLLPSGRLRFINGIGVLVEINDEWQPYDGFWILCKGKEGAILFNCMREGRQIEIDLMNVRFLLSVLDIPMKDMIKMYDIIKDVLMDYTRLVDEVGE